jgi:hypothetical protein
MAPDAASAMPETAGLIGSAAIADAAEQALRLSQMPRLGAERVEHLFDALTSLGLKPPTGWLARWRGAQAPASSEWQALAGEMVAAQDELLRRQGVLDRFDGDLACVETRLIEASHLVSETSRAIGGAARELGVQAEWLTRDLAPRLTTRAEDLLAQLIITRQNRVAIGLMRDTGQNLINAIERARRTMMSAFATAVTATRAIAEQALLQQQVDALQIAGGAVKDFDRAGARRMFDAALDDMRTSLDALKHQKMV